MAASSRRWTAVSPTCTDGETIEKQIKAAIGSGAELTDIGVNKPFYIEADTPRHQGLHRHLQ